MTRPFKELLESARDQREKLMSLGPYKPCPECVRTNKRFWTLYFAVQGAREKLHTVMDDGGCDTDAADTLHTVWEELYEAMLGRKEK